MKRLFRSHNPGKSDYTALVVFALAYLAAVSLILAPQQVKHFMDMPAQWTFGW